MLHTCYQNCSAEHDVAWEYADYMFFVSASSGILRQSKHLQNSTWLGANRCKVEVSYPECGQEILCHSILEIHARKECKLVAQ